MPENTNYRQTRNNNKNMHDKLAKNLKPAAYAIIGHRCTVNDETPNYSGFVV